MRTATRIAVVLGGLGALAGLVPFVALARLAELLPAPTPPRTDEILLVVWLADTPVLVLDEATAFADPQSEAAIQDALSELVRGRTLPVIGHRLTSFTAADRIVVLDRGTVAESGRHAELLAAGGRYARLWRAQEPVTSGATGGRA